MSDAGKDTIYIDIDDEITSIIDKVVTSKHKIVALVLPKRAAVLQSIVNMKLLKRSGDANKKNLVIITSEAGLLPLAGAVGLHVAKTLQSKPAIPAAPKVASDNVDLEDSDDIDTIADDSEVLDDAEEINMDANKSVGELAGGAAPAMAAEETIELDDEDDASTKDTKSDKSSKASKKDSKSDKKLKIPNFDKFRTRLLIGGGVLLLLIIFWYVGSFVLPTAKITIKTDNISVNTDINFTASTTAKKVDEAKSIVPAVEKTVKKTDAEKAPATGQKNAGERATGTVTVKLSNCDQDSVTIPAGTGVTNGGLTFITQADVTFNSVKIGNQCKNDNFPAFTSGTVKVSSQNPGDQYNISGGRSFTVAGFSNVAGVDSSSMSGGTTKNVTVVSDQDVETAKQKLTDKSKPAAVTELKKQLETDKLFSLPETLNSGTPDITTSPKVGDEATEVTVTGIVTYSMVGVKRDDLKALVTKSAKEKIDTGKQSISNDGLDKAIFKLVDRPSTSDQKLNVQSTVSTGAQIDQDALKKQIAGKKKGDVQQTIGALPNIKEVDVKYSPFWVYKTPSNPSKITIVFEQVSGSSEN